MGDQGTRRQFLAGVASGIGTTLLVARDARASRPEDGEEFTPVKDGFGFRNWAADNLYFDPPPAPTPSSVQERVRSGWRESAAAVLGLDTERLSDRLIEGIASQVRLGLVQRAGTNGHCYGMALTAQQYFEAPDTIPIGRATASDIEHPTAPLEKPDAPVYDEIVRRQAAQFLKFRAWLGRRAMLYPERLDTERILRDVLAVVDRFGTATLSLFDDSLFGHQVLAHAFEERADGVTISVYDPNRTAAWHGTGTKTLRFRREDDTFRMLPYGRYTNLLFNRYDQIERATGRGLASPIDHLSVERSTVHESLFPFVLVRMDSPAVNLTVVDPDGNPLRRLRGNYTTRDRGGAARVRSLYGASPGTYDLGVVGTTSTDYELTTLVAEPEGATVDEVRSETIEPGEYHEYALDVSQGTDGSLTRDGGPNPPLGLVAGGGAVAGATVGILGYEAARESGVLGESEES